MRGCKYYCISGQTIILTSQLLNSPINEEIKMVMLETTLQRLFIMILLYPCSRDLGTLKLSKPLYCLYLPLCPFPWAWGKQSNSYHRRGIKDKAYCILYQKLQSFSGKALYINLVGMVFVSLFEGIAIFINSDFRGYRIFARYKVKPTSYFMCICVSNYGPNPATMKRNHPKYKTPNDFYQSLTIRTIWHTIPRKLVVFVKNESRIWLIR